MLKRVLKKYLLPLLHRSFSNSSIEKHIDGLNNTVSFEKPQCKGLSITIHGNNNCIICGAYCSFVKAEITISGNNNQILLDECGHFEGHIHQGGNGNTFKMGAWSGFFESELIMEEGSSIIVGDDCMCSDHIDIRSSDQHSICDKNTQERQNPASDVRIGNHVWICHNVNILKGVRIPDGCVIGAGALVNKPFDEQNVIIAGNPARIVKRNITWSRDKSEGK
jgi:hypothetical protein